MPKFSQTFRSYSWITYTNLIFGTPLKSFFISRGFCEPFMGHFCQGWRVPFPQGWRVRTTTTTTIPHIWQDDENNQITPVCFCLSAQKGVVGDVIENFKIFGSRWKLVRTLILVCRLEKRKVPIDNAHPGRDVVENFENAPIVLKTGTEAEFDT